MCSLLMQRHRFSLLLLIFILSISRKCQKSAARIDSVEVYRLNSLAWNFENLADRNLHWLDISDNAPCDWAGVICEGPPSSNNQSLVEINLVNYDIIGIIKFASGFVHLRVFNLTGNVLRSTIPKQINDCKTLQVIDFSHNVLEGVLPPLGNLTALKTLSLSYNNLAGSFPGTACNGGSVTNIDMSWNKMAGTITKEISKCDSLLTLKLNNNGLHGALPTTLGELTNLEILDLSYNKLTGSLPTTIGQMKSLRQLLLKGNSLSGPIPGSIASLPSLTELDLSNNQIGNVIPTNIGDLTCLQILTLKNNKLRGSIPNSLVKLTSLTICDISSNRLNDSMPSALSSLKSLYYLNISHNMISGCIPSAIGSLSQLASLDLSHNNFSGPIPDTLSKLSMLSYFDGSYNQLNGSLPVALEHMTNVAVFDLSSNSLSGEISDVPLFRRWYESGYLQNNNFDLDFLEVHKFLQTKEDKMKYLPFFLLSLLGILILILMGLCLLWRIFWPQSFHKRIEYWEITLAPLLLCCGVKPRLSYKDLDNATDHFSSNNIIGVGPRATVFLGTTRKGDIAIKVFKEALIQEQQHHFLEDCRSLNGVNHRNVMCLKDWCYKDDFLAMVYEHMKRGTLYDNIYGKPHLSSLVWYDRLSIALDVALGLAFLHEMEKARRYFLCQLCPSNVLLDEQCAAKIAGLHVLRDLRAPIQDLDQALDGTHFVNYLPPECTNEVGVNKEGEVYCFGMTILELILPSSPFDGALRNVYRELFPDHLVPHIDMSILKTAPDFTQVLALIDVGLSCTQEDPLQRPDMVTVVDVLTKLKNGELDTTYFLPQ